MSEKDREPLPLSFSRSVKVDFQGSRVTSDGGLLLVRELGERLGLGMVIDEQLTCTGTIVGELRGPQRHRVGVG